MAAVVARLASGRADVRVHDAATIDYCVERLLETDDGGEDRARSYCRFVVLLIHFIY
jgi:hypothetical protein